MRGRGDQGKNRLEQVSAGKVHWVQRRRERATIGRVVGVGGTWCLHLGGDDEARARGHTQTLRTGVRTRRPGRHDG